MLVLRYMASSMPTEVSVCAEAGALVLGCNNLVTVWSDSMHHAIAMCAGHDYDVSGVFATRPREAPGAGESAGQQPLATTAGCGLAGVGRSSQQAVP